MTKVAHKYPPLNESGRAFLARTLGLGTDRYGWIWASEANLAKLLDCTLGGTLQGREWFRAPPWYSSCQEDDPDADVIGCQTWLQQRFGPSFSARRVRAALLALSAKTQK